MSDVKVDSFVSAVKDMAQEAAKVAIGVDSLNVKAAKVVAIGYLARKSKKEINSEARKASGLTDAQWENVKPPLSYAWRAIGGEYGFGDKLAVMWAKGDFSISLMKAYAKSAPPKKETDKIAQAVKLLVQLSEEERDDVLNQVETLIAEQNAAEGKKENNFAALVTEATVKVAA